MTFSGSRVALSRQVAAAPNQTVASLHSPLRLISSTSNSGTAEVLREVAGRAELDGSAWCKACDTAEELQARSVIGQASGSLLSRGTAIGIKVDPGPRRNRECLGPRLAR